MLKGIENLQEKVAKINFVTASGILIIIFCFSFVNSSAQPEWKIKLNDHEKVRQGFAQPPMWYAPHAYWFWDAPLDPEFIASMAKEMTAQRLNPGYVHARHNNALSTTYPILPLEQWLSPLWFNSFGAALKETENAGMTLGYCDEYWWPSGQAGGRVLKAYPELKAKSLEWTRQKIKGPATMQVSASKFSVAAQLTDKNLIMSNTLTIIGEGESFSWNVPKGNWLIYSYSIYHHPGVSYGKVSYLDPKLMDVFIPIAYQPYEDHFGTKMGKTIPGVFNDNEGDYGWKMAWSEYLVTRYAEMKERDIRLWMPLLTEQDAEGLWAKARYDWFDCVSDVYCNQFIGRMSDWLEKRDMYCISNFWEESLMLQTRAVGDFMRIQRTVTLPGNDCLQMKSQQVHDFKETQSVCEFEDRPFMSEIMGVAGWEQTPVQMKMTLNAVTAWGVTHTVPHAIGLNRKVETIPYPPDWFTENPYWRYLHLWTDFARRAAFVNRQGQLMADVLLLNPLESVWALSEGYFASEDGNQWDEKVIETDITYSGAMDALTRAGMDYLIADRYYMQKADIFNDNEDSPSPQIRIVNHAFSAIVLPPMFILSKSTAQKIFDFARIGGTVILLGDLPTGSPEKGAADAALVKQMEKLKTFPTVINLADEKDRLNLLPAILSQKTKPQFKILSGDLPLLISHRKIGQSDFYWLANNKNTEKEYTLFFRDGTGRAEIWDCETGGIHPISYKKQVDGCVVNLNIKPYEAFWLVFNPAKTPIPVEKKILPKYTEIKLNEPWQLSFPETNKIKVSTAKMLFPVTEKPDSKIYKLQYDDSDWKWHNLLGTTRFLEDWNASLLFNPDAFSNCYYRYTFNLASNPESAFLNIIADSNVRFWLNGKLVPPGKQAGSWAKVDLHDICSFLQKGKNSIAAEVASDYGYGWLIMQGLVKMENGKSYAILSNKNWKQSKSPSQDWKNYEFDESEWERVELLPPNISSKEIRSIPQPQKIDMGNNLTLWRISVPPSAKEVILPGLSKKAKIRIDGMETKVTSEKIVLPENAKLVVVQIKDKMKGLSSPAQFICRGSAPGELVSWIDMGLKRFSGFMDYEISFNLSSNREKLQLDLGEVLYMAEVWVNGQKVGERLWQPFTFDISEFVHSGKNELRIRIGNLAVNEIGLKDDLNELRHWGWTGTPPDSAFDAGLFGPVRIIRED